MGKVVELSGTIKARSLVEHMRKSPDDGSSAAAYRIAEEFKTRAEKLYAASVTFGNEATAWTDRGDKRLGVELERSTAADEIDREIDKNNTLEHLKGEHDK